jgi:hypothetical protein
MKQKDIALIVMVIGISAIVSFFISNAVFSPSKHKQQVDVVQPITSDFPALDSRFFNTSSFDPTRLIHTQQNNNTNPFASSSQ